MKIGVRPRQNRTKKNRGQTPYFMRIWVDADACPAVIKDILYRAAERAKIPLTLVANKLLRTPPSPYIRALQVPQAAPRHWCGSAIPWASAPSSTIASRPIVNDWPVLAIRTRQTSMWRPSRTRQKIGMTFSGSNPTSWPSTPTSGSAGNLMP